MHIISKKMLIDFCKKHAGTQSALFSWYKVASNASWKNLTDVQKTYREAESVGKFTVFNIKGNNLRLIVLIDYEKGKIFIRHVLTHAEYDKGRWKKDVWFK
jgi:mRNA interferase HigB